MNRVLSHLAPRDPANGKIGAMNTRPTVLVTGFDAFGGDPLNPSAQLAAALDGHDLDGVRIVGACLPTMFGTSAQRLAELLALHRPQLVLVQLPPR